MIDIKMLQKIFQNHGIKSKKKGKDTVIEINLLNIADIKDMKKEVQTILLIIHIKDLIKIVNLQIIHQIFQELWLRHQKFQKEQKEINKRKEVKQIKLQKNLQEKNGLMKEKTHSHNQKIPCLLVAMINTHGFMAMEIEEDYLMDFI